MRIILQSILLVCLLARALSDCRRDCLDCHRHLDSYQDGSKLLVCVMECEGKLVSRATWEFCRKAIQKASLQRDLDSLEEAASQPLETWDGSLLRGRGSLKHLGEDEKQVARVRTLVHQPEAGAGTSKGDRAPLQDFQDQLEFPQRLGGFLREPFSDGQMEEPTAQELQKRYGGFIGVRKAARKWHNQKRVSELLKQYLSMVPRSIEYDGLADDLKEQNEI
ncbi:prepronociceptin [Tiliqua scincoides]|uniref:prepronociceptin n=1 Tax=Tiliqua scincoides TaxID=71010 RepID=UPI003462542B